MKITLQKATVEDILVLISFEKTAEHLRVYSATDTREEWLEELNKSLVYLIVVNGEKAGSVMYEIKDDCSAYISGLIIDPRFHRRGIARTAMLRILEELKDMERIYLFTHPENEPAFDLYSSLGFIVGLMGSGVLCRQHRHIQLQLRRWHMRQPKDHCLRIFI